MSVSARPKAERINQVWLDEAIEAHDNYLRGTPMEPADTRGAIGFVP